MPTAQPSCLVGDRLRGRGLEGACSEANPPLVPLCPQPRPQTTVPSHPIRIGPYSVRLPLLARSLSTLGTA